MDQELLRYIETLIKATEDLLVSIEYSSDPEVASLNCNALRASKTTLERYLEHLGER